MRPLALAIALVCGVIALIPASADARVRDCLRGGAKLVAASETVRVVRVARRPRGLETRHDRLLGCRTTNGRRFLLRDEIDQADDYFQHSSFSFVDDHYIGGILDEYGAQSDFRWAVVWDSRTRTKLHTSDGCTSNPGVHEAVFLPRGDLAYSCDALYLATAREQRQLEPPGSFAHDLAAAVLTFTYRLYWFVDGPGPPREKSLLVRHRR